MVLGFSMLLTFDSFLADVLAHNCLALRGRGYQLSHSYQVVSCSRESEHPPDSINSSMPSLAHHRDGLHPAKDFFYSLSFVLAYCISNVPGCSFVYRTRVVAICVLGNMRSNIQFSQLGYQAFGVVRLIASHCYPSAFTNLTSELGCHLTLCKPVRLGKASLYYKSVSILCKHMTKICQFCFSTLSFLIQSSLWVSSGLMSLVASLFSVKVNCRIATIFRRLPIRFRLLRFLLLLKTLLPGPRLDQCSVYREVLIAQQLVLARLLEHLVKERFSHLPFKQPVSILAKGCGIPYFVIHAQPYEPSKQKVVVQLLHQHSLASHAIQ